MKGTIMVSRKPSKSVVGLCSAMKPVDGPVLATSGSSSGTLDESSLEKSVLEPVLVQPCTQSGTSSGTPAVASFGPGTCTKSDLRSGTHAVGISQNLVVQPGTCTRSDIRSGTHAVGFSQNPDFNPVHAQDPTHDPAPLTRHSPKIRFYIRYLYNFRHKIRLNAEALKIAY